MKENLDIKGLEKPVMSWVNHPMSTEEHNMLRNISRLPCLYKHVALMPDAHLGIGSMVGSVVATKDAIIPATVGVDIGCGLMAIKTPFKSGILDGKLKKLRLAIESVVPVGFNWFNEMPKEADKWKGWNNFDGLTAKLDDRKKRAMQQIGTLGGGELIASPASNSR